MCSTGHWAHSVSLLALAPDIHFSWSLFMLGSVPCPVCWCSICQKKSPILTESRMQVRTMARPPQFSLNTHIVTAALPKGMQPPVELRNGKQGSWLFPLSPSLPLRLGSPASISGQGAGLDSSRPQKEKAWWHFPSGSLFLKRNTEAALSVAVPESDPRPLLPIVKVKREALHPSDSLVPSYFVHPSLLSISWYFIFIHCSYPICLEPS